MFIWIAGTTNADFFLLLTNGLTLDWIRSSLIESSFLNSVCNKLSNNFLLPWNNNRCILYKNKDLQSISWHNSNRWILVWPLYFVYIFGTLLPSCTVSFQNKWEGEAYIARVGQSSLKYWNLINRRLMTSTSILLVTFIPSSAIFHKSELFFIVLWI